MFMILGIFTVCTLLVVLVLCCVDLGTTKLLDSIFENTAACFLIKLLIGVLLICSAILLKLCH